MSKISVLYMAVDYKDAHDFLIWLIDKTRSYIPIVRFDRKRYVLETDKCVVGTFILNHPCRGRALRNSADFFLQSNKPFEARLRIIKDLYWSSLQGIEELGINAKEIAKELGVPLEEKLLSRPFQGKEQKTLGGIERFGGVIGAFDCAENKITENAAVLLCDDISTTGATLNECAKLLLLRGADKVYCVSAAITKKEDGKCSEQTSE